jgi:hypothetical protein
LLPNEDHLPSVLIRKPSFFLQVHDPCDKRFSGPNAIEADVVRIIPRPKLLLLINDVNRFCLEIGSHKAWFWPQLDQIGAYDFDSH